MRGDDDGRGGRSGGREEPMDGEGGGWSRIRASRRKKECEPERRRRRKRRGMEGEDEEVEESVCGREAMMLTVVVRQRASERERKARRQKTA